MADTNIKQFDPEKCKASIGGITPRAFADGVMIKIAFDVPKRKKHIGVDGAGRHLLSRDRSGTITVRLASYSPTNGAFGVLDTVDKPFPIGFVDKSSNGDSFFASSCTLTQVPDMTKGDDETPNEYVFQFINGKLNHVGAESDSILSALAQLGLA